MPTGRAVRAALIFTGITGIFIVAAGVIGPGVGRDIIRIGFLVFVGVVIAKTARFGSIGLGGRREDEDDER